MSTRNRDQEGAVRREVSNWARVGILLATGVTLISCGGGGGSKSYTVSASAVSRWLRSARSTESSGPSRSEGRVSLSSELSDLAT